jgi:hypothetical protein
VILQNMCNGNATGQSSAKIWKILLQDNSSMFCNIEGYNGKATGNALQFRIKLWLGDRTMLYNFEKYNGNSTDNALQFWKRLWLGDRTMLCNIKKYNGKGDGAMLCNVGKVTEQCSAVLEKIMGRRQDNALKFCKKLLLGDRTMLCNIGKDYGKATGQALQY